MRTIVLIEEAWVGHRPMYNKMINKTLLGLGYRIITFCPQPQALEEFIGESCQPQNGQYAIFEYSRDTHPLMKIQELDPIRKKVNMWKAAKQAIDGIIEQLGKAPDLVFFGVLDGYLATGLTAEVIGQAFPYSWSGLYFHPSHLRVNKEAWSLVPDAEQPHAGLYADLCLAVGVLDEGISSLLEERLHGKPVFLLPEAINEVETDFSTHLLLPQILEKARGRKIVGLLGSLSKRKGIFKLIEIAKKMKSEDFFFVFGGQLFPKTFTAEEQVQLLEIICSNMDNCFFYINTIPEKEMDGLFSSCDILFGVYNHFLHSSSTQTRASAFRKPVIVSKAYCMGERAAKYNLGIGVNDENNIEECIQAIRQLANHPLKHPDYEGDLAANSIDRLPEVFQKILAACFKSDQVLEVKMPINE